MSIQRSRCPQCSEPVSYSGSLCAYYCKKCDMYITHQSLLVRSSDLVIVCPHCNKKLYGTLKLRGE